jgi:DNA-binding LacI/PurR family transcriptional regulator
MGALVAAGDKRKHYYVGHLPEDGETEPHRRVDEVRQALRLDLLQGTVPIDRGDALPGMKLLAGRYECGPRTVRHALRELVEEGLCTTRGSRFVYRGLPTRRFRTASICLVGPRRLVHATLPGQHPTVSEIEREVSLRGWGPIDLRISAGPERCRFPPTHRVAAYVLVVTTRHEAWIEHLDRFRRTPLVIIDRSESVETIPRRNNCFLVQACNRSAGRIVGRRLRALGHRQVAFFHATSSRSHWEHSRLAALRERYPNEEGELSMRTYQRTRRPDHPPSVMELLGWRGTRVHVILANSGLLPIESVRERMRPLETLNDLLDARHGLFPSFEQALEDPDTTAWVCANDEVAALAVHFLRGATTKRSRRISVVGFDNTPISYMMGFSSYDFGHRAMAHLALECIAHPDSVRKADGGRIAVEGHIVERRSLRRVSS